MYKIIIAPNSFKGSLAADEVALAIEQGLKQSQLIFQSEKFPIGDGGDHTASLLTDHLNGEFRCLPVLGAYGDLVEAGFGLVKGGRVAVLEVAETSGFKSIIGEANKPLKASTRGLGQLINHVLDLDVSEIILCLGGSATIDGGIGMLSELGVKFMDMHKNNILAVCPENFTQVAFIDASTLEQRIGKCEFTVLCDVTNPLLGENGAAKVFGPQKGASENEVVFLAEFLTRFNELTFSALGKSLDKVESGGAAGGLGATLGVYLNAQLLKGAEHFCKMTDFGTSLSKADLLITGEGSIDAQSLSGKAPFVVAKYALAKHIPVIGLAGAVPRVITNDLQQYFSMLLSIGNQPEPLGLAIKNTKANLIRTAKQIGNIITLYDAPKTGRHRKTV